MATYVGVRLRDIFPNRRDLRDSDYGVAAWLDDGTARVWPSRAGDALSRSYIRRMVQRMQTSDTKSARIDRNDVAVNGTRVNRSMLAYAVRRANGNGGALLPNLQGSASRSSNGSSTA